MRKTCIRQVFFFDFMTQASFKTNVLKKILIGAKIYQSAFLNYDYQIVSVHFRLKKCYIIAAEKDNFLHLTGVHTELSAGEFFERAIRETLTENDFDFVKKGQSEAAVKGSVRRKVQFLPILDKILQQSTLVEEDFSKNKITCSLAMSENSFTLGFVMTPNGRPKTLLKGNELKNYFAIDSIKRRKRGEKIFEDFIVPPLKKQ